MAINLPSFLDLAVERVLLASLRESFFEDYFGRRQEIFLAMLSPWVGCGAVDRSVVSPILTPRIGRRSSLPIPQSCRNRFLFDRWELGG
jgi:hypothetical protein